MRSHHCMTGIPGHEKLWLGDLYPLVIKAGKPNCPIYCWFSHWTPPFTRDFRPRWHWWHWKLFGFWSPVLRPRFIPRTVEFSSSMLGDATIGHTKKSIYSDQNWCVLSSWQGIIGSPVFFVKFRAKQPNIPRKQHIKQSPAVPFEAGGSPESFVLDTINVFFSIELKLCIPYVTISILYRERGMIM